MKAARVLFIIGTIHWFLLTIGHPILVDFNLGLGRPGPFGPEVVPDGNLVRETLLRNTWDFGWLGSTSAQNAFASYSVWLWASTFFLGLIDVVIGLSRKLPRELFYRLTLLNLAAYVVFTVYSFVFFVRAPQFNGVVGILMFGLAAWLMAREHDGQAAHASR